MDILLELHYTVGQLEGHRGIHVITKIIDHTLSQFVGVNFSIDSTGYRLTTLRLGERKTLGKFLSTHTHKKKTKT